MNTQNPALKIEIIKVDDSFAYDVTLLDEDATIGLYIEALDAFLEEKVAPCLGCDLCCKQRIPLTLPDLYGYAGFDGADQQAFLEEKTEIRKNGLAYDVKLAQRDDNSCVFLDRKNQRCLDHPRRGLVCHTYICLPQTERARILREALINSGEDALVGHLFRLGVLKDEKGQNNYPTLSAWEGKTFAEIKLRDILSPSAFAALF